MFDYKGFMSDFRIADKFGIEAIKDTFDRAFEGWKDNVEYYASLVMTLNHQLWYWYEKGDEMKSGVYNELWTKAYDWGTMNFKGEDLNYYYRFLD